MKPLNCPNCQRVLPLAYTGTACPSCFAWLGDVAFQLLDQRISNKKGDKRA